MKTPLTPFRRFVEKWKDGCGHEQCEKACRVVLCRGKVPADLLFIGEAPGVSEDVLGQPFVGPAGLKLDEIIEGALDAIDLLGSSKAPRIAFTNVVGCIPSAWEGKMAEPPDDQVESCIPRLQEFLDLVKPKVLFCVGRIARDWTDPMIQGGLKHRLPRVPLMHPAFILRKPHHEQTMFVNKTKLAIAEAIRKYLLTEGE